MEIEPWKMISHLFPDLVFLVEGKKLYYHQAVLAQHSQLVKSLLIKNSCCQCKGVDCSRNAGNVFVTLDGVKTDTVQYVMDMIYAGSGNMAGDTEDYKSVLDMLQINTIVVDALNSFEGFILEEIFRQGGSDVTDGSSSLNDVLEEESRKVDQELKETNKALKKLEREKKKLAVEEKKKQEIERKRDRRSRNRKPVYAEENSRDGLQDNTEDAMEVDETKTVETIEPTRTETVVIQKSKSTSDTPQTPTVTTKSSNNQPPISKSFNDDDDCEIIIDSEIEKKNITVEVKAEEAERYICPFKDCRSESKNAQSIKVHLALVHYKKSIQSEFPNWKKQKCDECEKSFGQMTAYYLHMANHKKYQYMDLPAQAMMYKDENQDKSKQSSTTKAYKSSSSPLIRGSSNLTTTPMSSSSTTITPSSTSTNIIRKSGAIIKPSSLAHARSNSFVQSSTPTQANRTNSVSAGLARSKSFVQTKSQPQITSNKLQSLIARTTTGSKTNVVSSSATFGRPTPPGPPGPSSVSSTRSNSLNRSTGPFISSNKKSSTPPGPHQRRLSAPYSVVTKRTGSLERPAAKDTKKTRGS